MLAAGLWLALVLAFAPATLLANAERTTPNDRPVSTSPKPVSSPVAMRVDPRGLASTTAPPRTRAAARKQIDEMSPLDWLARFGSVSVEPRD